MHPKYPNVFKPIKLGPIELRNRFYASPQSMPMNIGGKPSDDFVHYNLARAKGGCGLIMVSMASHMRGRTIQPCAHPNGHVAAFRALTDAVHGAGAKVFAEPYYHWQSAGTWQILSPSAPAMGPSVIQFGYNDRRSTTRAMTRGEIQGSIEGLAQSAANLREAGFDGLMLHAAHGAILEQFLSPYFNRRTDDYGGSLENRMRLLVESLQAVREAAGSGMAVGTRLNCDEMLKGGYDQAEAYQILKTLTDRGLVDFVDLDVAVEPDQFWLGMPSALVEKHVYRPYVEAIRSAAGDTPVLSVLGRLTSVAEAEDALVSGVCDMVGAARAVIAEPNLVKNAYEGHEDRSRACISCNWCMALMQEGVQTCAINPASYRERSWGEFAAAARPSKVVVVGGGPAGLEAARVSALKGHRVVLFEAEPRLGGALALWAKLPGREVNQNSIDWWVRELERLGVDIRLGVKAAAAQILAEKPDAVIVATGSRYSQSGVSNHRDFGIPGHDKDFVHRPEEVLSGAVQPSGKVLILDAEGYHTGVGLAEKLAAEGAQVELVTPYSTPVSARLAASQEAPLIMQRIKRAGVTVTPTTYIKQIGDHEVSVYDVHSEQERVIKGLDAVILSTGRVSVNALEGELEGKVGQLFTAGDALAIRTWSSAAFEGHKFARYIGEPGAPASIADVYFGADEPELMSIPADMVRAPQPVPA